jgi:phosphoheptose isomerase
MYIERLINRYRELEAAEPDIRIAARLLIDCFEKGGKLLICGNGGSAADCEHMAGELLKGFMKKRPLSAGDAAVLGEELASRLQYGLPAIPLVSADGIMTAVINDLGGDMVFAQQVMALGTGQDLLMGISTSGNALNITNAIRAARLKGMKVLSLTGCRASKMSVLSDVCIKVPAESTPDVQEYHLPIYHALCAQTEAYFFKE